LIIGGGAVVPTLVLAVLVVYGLAPIPALLAPAPDGSLKISVSGEQWWWRVRYELSEGGAVALANEIRLPVGRPVEFRLESPDVIHSFWIPSLAGKIDMIPGRVTRLALTPTKVGVFRGACAEYCGTSHALMSFYVVVEEQEAFERWLAAQQAPAAAPSAPDAASGQELFLANGCGACHMIRGTPARGVVGPDLTHIGSRVSIGAGILPNNAETLMRWIARTDHVKPAVIMPAFGMLPQKDLQALARYLEGLK
jgi:cytochrome c oxidase subunit 2